MSPRQLSPDDSEGLRAYFTDVEHLRASFRQFVAAPTLSKRLLVIHGVGGVGKSSLLRMYRLHCKSAGVPVGLVSGDEAKSAVDVLSTWASDLKADGVPLPIFAQTVEHYRAIQAKVDEQTGKMQEARGKAVDIAGTAASKAAEAAAGAVTGAAVGSVIPGMGTLVGSVLGGVAGSMSAEALVDWLRGFLAKPDIDLLLDPARKLTEDFLDDVARIAPERRLVLLLDTYEQMMGLDDWARDLAQQLHPNVLLVIAGRAMPNWSRQWPGWLAQAQVEELKPMTRRVMIELVHRYYAHVHGGEPDPRQVRAIIDFARGLPMVVNSAVQLWVQYGVEDFYAVKPQVVADLVDRLVEGVPQEMRPALEAAAVVHWFNKEILRAVTGQADVNAVYDELRRFPFVRPRVEGLALHDAVREILEENLKLHDPERHSELHKKAAEFFEARLAEVTSEEAERLDLERLYHRVHADEETGIHMFQERAEELVGYRLVNRLRALLNDANAYALEKENSRLWREYYTARLAHLEARFADAGEAYQAISENERANPKLRAYALCDWGQILEIFRQRERSIPTLKEGLSIVPIDSKLAFSLLDLGNALRRKGELEESKTALERARDFYERSGDRYGWVYALSELKHYCLNQGLFREAPSYRQQAMEALASFSPELPSLKMEVVGGFAIGWSWLGRLDETERDLQEAYSIARRLGLRDETGFIKDLGYVAGMQGKYEEAEEYFDQFSQALESIAGGDREAWLGIKKGARGTVLARQGRLDEAEQELGQGLAYKRETRDFHGIPEACNWLGMVHEAKAREAPGEAGAAHRATAESYYRQSLELQWTGRRYFKCGALTGLVRVKCAQGDCAAAPPLLAEAEQLAQQHEYNDHLAALRLAQGHAAWDGRVPEWDGGFEAALGYYRQALVYALRYNRFLLDEVLGGGDVYTPLCPIIPGCLERSEEGRQALAALRDWWQTGLNDVGAPRPDTLSPFPEGISLLEAERIAREREPGDGSPQKTVLEQIDAALA